MAEIWFEDDTLFVEKDGAVMAYYGCEFLAPPEYTYEGTDIVIENQVVYVSREIKPGSFWGSTRDCPGEHTDYYCSECGKEVGD